MWLSSRSICNSIYRNALAAVAASTARLDQIFLGSEHSSVPVLAELTLGYAPTPPFRTLTTAANLSSAASILVGAGDVQSLGVLGAYDIVPEVGSVRLSPPSNVHDLAVPSLALITTLLAALDYHLSQTAIGYHC